MIELPLTEHSQQPIGVSRPGSITNPMLHAFKANNPAYMIFSAKISSLFVASFFNAVLKSPV